jgi:hypothetical protein
VAAAEKEPLEEFRGLARHFQWPVPEIPQAGPLMLAEITDAGIGDSSGPERHWLGETEDVRKEQLQAGQKSEKITGLASRTQEVLQLARLLKSGTVFLTLDEVSWIIWVVGEGVKGH